MSTSGSGTARLSGCCRRRRLRGIPRRCTRRSSTRSGLTAITGVSRGCARAYGNVPDMTGAAAERVDLSRWADCLDAGSQIAGGVALAFAVAPDASRSAIAVAGRRADGLNHGELTEPPRPGTAGLVA